MLRDCIKKIKPTIVIIDSLIRVHRADENSAKEMSRIFAAIKDLVREGITFNSVAPGGIMIPDTGWEQEQKKDPIAFRNMLNEKFPLGKLGKPEEVASVVVFICSEKASLVNGASIPVDGSEGRSF